ncbi:MAG: EGFR-like transmembrane domain-containing protein [Planctomycetota bacterium]
MSYEYLLGLGAEQQQRPAQRRRISPEESCGGIRCPEGLSNTILVRLQDPVRLAEFEENMRGRGCVLLCNVGDSYTYCCPSASEARDVVTDPFATAPVELDAAAALLVAVPDGEVDDRSLAIPVILGVLGLGVAGLIGFAVLRRKSKKEKS